MKQFQIKSVRVLAAAIVPFQIFACCAPAVADILPPTNQTSSQTPTQTSQRSVQAQNNAQSNVDALNSRIALEAVSTAVQVPVLNLTLPNNDYLRSDGNVIFYGYQSMCSHNCLPVHPSYSFNLQTLQISGYNTALGPYLSNLVNARPEDRPFFWHRELNEMIGLVSAFRDALTNASERDQVNQVIAALNCSLVASGVVSNGDTAVVKTASLVVAETAAFDVNRHFSMKVVYALQNTVYDGQSFIAGEVMRFGQKVSKSGNPSFWVTAMSELFDSDNYLGRLQSDPQTAGDPALMSAVNAIRRSAGVQDAVQVRYVDSGGVTLTFTAQIFSEWARIASIGGTRGVIYYLNISTGEIISPDYYGNAGSTLSPSGGAGYALLNAEIRRRIQSAIDGTADMNKKRVLADLMNRMAAFQAYSDIRDSQGRLLHRVVYADNGRAVLVRSYDTATGMAVSDTVYSASTGDLIYVITYASGTTQIQYLSYYYPGTTKIQCRYEYDAQGRLSAVAYFNAAGRPTQLYSYDPFTGRVSTILQYDASGNLTVRYAYNTLNGVLRQVDYFYIGTARTQYRYLYNPVSGSLINILYLDANGLTTFRYSYSAANGGLISVESFDANGRIVSLAVYNPVTNRLLNIYQYFAGTTKVRYRYDYDAAGNLRSLSAFDLSGTVVVTQTYYPGGGVMSITRYNAGRPYAIEQYDQNGRLIRVTRL